MEWEGLGLCETPPLSDHFVKYWTLRSVSLPPQSFPGDSITKMPLHFLPLWMIQCMQTHVPYTDSILSELETLLYFEEFVFTLSRWLYLFLLFLKENWCSCNMSACQCSKIIAVEQLTLFNELWTSCHCTYLKAQISITKFIYGKWVILSLFYSYFLGIVSNIWM